MSRTMTRLGGPTFALALGLASCVPAQIGEPGGTDGDSKRRPSRGTSGVDLIRDRSLCKAGAVGPAPVRRISRLEYNNMVADLLGDTAQPASRFVAEEKVLGFNSNVLTPVTELATEQYLVSAEELSEKADVASLSGCGAALPGACVEPFLERFARRAFRGTLEQADRDRLLTTYRDAAQAFDADSALRLGIRSVLLSPRFLYVIELGQPGADPVAALTPPELAGRLALYFWRSVPDDELLARADSGQLQTREQIADEARRLLSDPRAQSTLEDFALQWLDLERIGTSAKSPELYPEYTPELAADFKAETVTFFREFVAARAPLPKLFTAPFSFLNQRLAGFYGVAFAGGAGLSPTDLNAAERAGILTQASVLTAQAHPTKAAPILRGKLVRERVFCQTLPVPPPNVDMNVPDPGPGATTTDTFRQHASNEACASCHKLMDPIGFGFSNYDAIGKFVTVENGLPLSGHGEVIGAARDLDGAFNGATELGKRISESEHVKQCFAVQGFRYAFGRAEVEADACSLQSAYDAFEGSGFVMAELMVAIASSDGFRQRPRVVAEGACR